MKLQFDATDSTLPFFKINGTFPSLNEYLAACNKNPHVGAKMKSDYTFLASNSIRRYLKRWNTEKKIIIHYHFYEPNMKRDHDNVFSMASKCIQDALIKTKTISNDGWKNIENFTHDFFVSKDKPRIEVWIEVIDE